MMKTFASALVLSLVSPPLIVTSAVASNGNWQVGNDQIHVIDDTIDITSKAGRIRLLNRVERAAEKLCRSRVGVSRRECEIDTIEQTTKVQSRWGQAIAAALQERGATRMTVR